jgi:hypothetical protein
LGGEARIDSEVRIYERYRTLIAHAHLQLKLWHFQDACQISSDDLRDRPGWLSIAHMTRPSLRLLPMKIEAPCASSSKRVVDSFLFTPLSSLRLRDLG